MLCQSIVLALCPKTKDNAHFEKPGKSQILLFSLWLSCIFSDLFIVTKIRLLQSRDTQDNNFRIMNFTYHWPHWEIGRVHSRISYPAPLSNHTDP